MKKTIVFVLIFALLAACAPDQELLAEATPEIALLYDGFGENVSGCGNGQTYHVTNTSNSGSGSLREAVSQAGRCVVFDVGGTINMSSDMRVSSNITIDGLTAPAPGITLTGRTLIMEDGVNNIIVRGIRVRGSGDDGIRVYNSHDIVITQVSVSGFGDGAVDITQGSYNVTLSWSILGNGVSSHNFPTLVSYTPERISIHHNLYSNSVDRNPKCALGDSQSSNPSNTVTCDVRNNLVWNFRQNGSRNDNGSNVNVIRNYYYSSYGSGNAITVSSGARVYAEGNYSQNGYNPDTRGNTDTPFAAAEVETQDALTAAMLVVERAGARGDNFGLDSLDQAYVSQVKLDGSPQPPTPTRTPTVPVTPGTPPPTFTPAPPTPTPSPLPGLYWQAEDGQIELPFGIENGLVFQQGNTYDSDQGGHAIYQFSIQQPGDYVLRAWVNAPSLDNNSFFWNIDGEPTSEMIWDIEPTIGVQERYAYWRLNSPFETFKEPMVFELSAGQHTLIIRGREALAALDKIQILPVAEIPPTVTPTPTFTQVPPTETPTSTPTNTPTSTFTPTLTVTPVITVTPIIGDQCVIKVYQDGELVSDTLGFCP